MRNERLLQTEGGDVKMEQQETMWNAAHSRLSSRGDGGVRRSGAPEDTK